MISVSAQSVRYSKVKLNLYLFRHGKTAFNESDLLSGTSDDPLTEEGVYQLKKMVEKFQYPSADALFSSPLSRCIQTAAILYPKFAPIIVPDLREIGFGQLEHTPIQDLQSSNLGRQLLSNDFAVRFPGGESKQDCLDRAIHSMDTIFSEACNQGWTRVAVSSHTCFIQILLSSVEDKASKAVAVVPNGMGYHILLDSDVWFRNRTFTLVDKIPREAW